MDLDKLIDNRRLVYVPFQGEKIAMEYDINGYGDDIYVASAQIAKMAEDNPRRHRINNKILLQMVKAWDLTNGCTDECVEHKNNGSGPFCREHSIPVTEESISKIPLLLRGRMVSRIMEDINADSDDPKPSSSF